MFQFAFVAVLFQFRARKPQLSPLLQFPNRRQTPQVTPSLSPYILLFIIYAASKLRYLPGECFAPPGPPLYGYADRWQKKIGGADAPGRMRGRVVPTPRPQAATKPIVANPEPQADARESLLRVFSP